VSQEAAALFASLLASPDHSLMEEELLQISEILDWASDAKSCPRRLAKTETVSGRRVLIIEVVQPSNKEKVWAIFLPDPAQLGNIQEIQLKMPEAETSHLGLVNTLLSAIRWTVSSVR